MLKFTNYSNANLKHILAVYGSDDVTSIEHYFIKEKTLPAAKPLSVETANSIFKHLQFEKGAHLSFKNLIPKEILHVNNNSEIIIWKCKAQRRKLFFKNELLKTNTYTIPNLVFKLNGVILSVFATKTYNVTAKTTLFNAPFLNVWSNGSVCMGSANINKENLDYYEEVIAQVEELFFNSYFTHTNHDTIVNTNLIELYKELETADQFPKNILIKSTTKNITKLCKL